MGSVLNASENSVPGFRCKISGRAPYEVLHAKPLITCGRIESMAIVVADNGETGALQLIRENA